MTGEQYLETSRRSLLWTGLCRPLRTPSKLNVLFILWPLFIFGIYVLILAGCIADVKFVRNNNLLAGYANVLQVMIYLSVLGELVYCQTRNESIHRMVKRVREAFRFSSNTGYLTMETTMRMDYYTTVGWTTTCTMVTTVWISMAMIQGELAIPFWAPMDLLKSPRYEILTFLQFLGQYFVGSIGGCFDCFYFRVLSSVGKQFEIITCSLQHIAVLAVRRTRRRIEQVNGIACKSGSSKGPEAYIQEQTDTSCKCECCSEEFRRFFGTFERRRQRGALTASEMRIYQEELQSALKDCIEHHQRILPLIHVIEDFFGPILLYRFILGTVTLCFIIYSTSKFMASPEFSITAVKFISLAGYYVVASTELFLYCYVAENFSHRSHVLSGMILQHVPWFGAGITKEFISILKVFHVNSRQSFGLRVGVTEISLRLFISMFRASISYFNFLRAMRND